MCFKPADLKTKLSLDTRTVTIFPASDFPTPVGFAAVQIEEGRERVVHVGWSAMSQHSWC